MVVPDGKGGVQIVRPSSRNMLGDRRASRANMGDRRPSGMGLGDRRPSGAAMGDRRPSGVTMGDRRPSGVTMGDRRQSGVGLGQRRASAQGGLAPATARGASTSRGPSSSATPTMGERRLSRVQRPVTNGAPDADVGMLRRSSFVQPEWMKDGRSDWMTPEQRHGATTPSRRFSDASPPGSPTTLMMTPGTVGGPRKSFNAGAGSSSTARPSSGAFSGTVSPSAVPLLPMPLCPTPLTVSVPTSRGSNVNRKADDVRNALLAAASPTPQRSPVLSPISSAPITTTTSSATAPSDKVQQMFGGT